MLKELRLRGWVITRQRGSHIQLVHPKRPGRVTVPHPKKDLDIETVMTILRQAGIDPSDLERRGGN
ncbi:MAG: type II toxin-antitoxin system HicA family toxin [Bacillota bacterium]